MKGLFKEVWDVLLVVLIGITAAVGTVGIATISVILSALPIILAGYVLLCMLGVI